MLAQKHIVVKAAVTLLVLGTLAAGITLTSAFSAFSSTTTNSGNNYSPGTVNLTDNDTGAAMYSLTGKKPGDTNSLCINVTYDGTLPANVRLYTTSTVNSPPAQYINLTIDKGTSMGAFPDCTGFTSQAQIYSGTLANFVTTKNSYTNGVSTYPAAQTQWNQNDALVYKFVLTLQDNNGANGGATPFTTGSHDFKWEAQNQ